MRIRKAAVTKLPRVPDLEGARIAEGSFVATFVVSEEGELLRVNARFASLLGAGSVKELVGLPVTDLVPSRPSWTAWRRDCVAGTERDVRLKFNGLGGHDVVLRGDVVPSPGGPDGVLVGMFVDVSEEEKLREAVQRSARMEALGSLTSGIAHDFNNLLTVLLGNLYLVVEDLREDPKVFAKLKAARDAAKRGTDLIRQLLAFSRRESVDAAAVSPGKVIEDLTPLLRRALGAKVELDARLSPDAGRVRCNAAQLESVVVNLCVNARDAIEETGSISVTVEPAELGPREARPSGLPAGDYVKLAVIDDGGGIPKDTLERVFEPFFTTKANRGGTGLGLSMVRWFAEQAGGAVDIDSRPQEGTCVALWLPRTAEHEEDTSARTSPLSTLPGGDESVLVFARDEGLGSTITQTLEVLGYGVRITTGAEETLRGLRGHPVDLLLIDAAAQHEPARQQLIKAAMAAKPGLRVVVAVDASEAARARRASVRTRLLGKPFSIADLAETLRRALDEGTPGN